MAFFKQSKSLLKLWFISVFSFENKPWGWKSSAAGVKIESTRGQNLVHPHKHWLCVDALNFDTRQHSILTPSSTWVWSPRPIFKTEKSYKSQFQKGFATFEKIHTSYNIPTVLFYFFIFFFPLGILLRAKNGPLQAEIR